MIRNFDGTIGPASPAEIKAIADRIEKADKERESNHRAWNRLCGMLSPIGGPSHDFGR